MGDITSPVEIFGIAAAAKNRSRELLFLNTAAYRREKQSRSDTDREASR